MRIRSYLALLVLSCLIGAYTLEQILAYHFNYVQTLAESHNKHRLWAKDLERIENTTSQFLISTDLVLGSGNSYLIFGTKNIGNYLASELTVIHEQNTLKQFDTPINQSIQQIKEINTILDTIANISPEQVDAHLTQLLVKYDPVSLALSKNIQQLMLETQTTIQQKAQALNQEKQHNEEVAWTARALFFLLIALLWWWANQKICKPISGLIYSSNRALSGDTFKATNNAPTEIIELSSDFKRLTQTLFHQASHDPLTELQNRRAFERNLTEIINDKSNRYFLCFIDLDYFKTINDTCGHAAGDEILVSVARILKENVRAQDIIARLGGDEFALLIKNCPVEKTLQLANNIRKNIRNLTYHWEGETFQLSASIGIAPKITESTTTDLLNSADIACSLAKNAGRNTVHLFDISTEHLAEKRQDMLSVHQINNAITNNAFILYKQDIVPLQQQKEGQCIEILLRMKNTQGEIVSPAAFFPIAERYNLSSKIDRWVINAVFQHFATHKEALENIHMISINLSGQSLTDKDLENFIIKRLHDAKLPAERICFEITETAAITNVERARLFMENIKALGCKFALDDFGSGHSSYAYVKEFPIDIIKIDGSFIVNIMENPLDYTAVKSICEIAKTANKKVVAEYIEDEKVIEVLTKLSIDYGQGYYFDKPSPLV